MEKIIYQKLVKKYKPKENRLFNTMIAFFVGGILGVIGELLVEFYSGILDISTKEAVTFMIITLIRKNILIWDLQKQWMSVALHRSHRETNFL